MQKWKNTGWLAKTSYSMNGFRAAFKTEKSIRQETAVVFVACAAAIFMKRSAGCLFAVFAASLFPLVVELINTAAERMIDSYYGPVYREEVKIQKDILSAAVLLSLFIGYSISLKIIIWG